MARMRIVEAALVLLGTLSGFDTQIEASAKTSAPDSCQVGGSSS